MRIRRYALEHRLNRPGSSLNAGTYGPCLTRQWAKTVRDHKVQDLLSLHWEVIRETDDEVELAHPDLPHTSLYRIVEFGPFDQ